MNAPELPATSAPAALAWFPGPAAAAALVVVLAPVLAALALRSGFKARKVFESAEAVGADRQTFRRLRFAGGSPGSGLAVLFNLMRGEMAWVGPRPVAPAEADSIGAEFAQRYTLRPGLIYPHAVRKNLGIAYETEWAAERDFFFGPTPGSHAGLAVRHALGRLLAGGQPRPMPAVLNFFGVAIANMSMEDALDWIAGRVRAGQPSLLAFVNPDCLNIAYGHEAYRRALAQAALVLPDGVGIKLGCRILGVELRENVNGTDLFPRLCERSAAEGFSLFLLGARPGVAETTAAAMVSRYPGLKIAGTRDGYFEDSAAEAVVAEINRSGADILLTAFGAPRQELWLAAASESLKPSVRLGVGGLFDFYSGRIPRAPLWMREIGLEWLFRLIQEPGRLWRRYIIGNPLFLYRVWLQRRTENPDDQAA
jgi:N-acetylglucosaminyldiphosphoundecaprenol N-acetyl-beta-D-mannosaminyltransferase